MGCRRLLRLWSNGASRSRRGESDRCRLDCMCSHCPGNLPGIGIAIRTEGDPAAVGRPGRPEVSRAAVCEVWYLRPGEVEQPEIGEALRPV